MATLESFILGSGEMNVPELTTKILAEVYGVVTGVEKKVRYASGKWSNTKFTILAPKKQITFNCECVSFCRVEPEDRIYAIGLYSEQKGIHVLEITETPIVEPAVTKAAIIQTFIKALPRRGKLAAIEAEDFYKSLCADTAEMEEYKGLAPGERINFYMTKLANEYRKNGSLGAEATVAKLHSLDQFKALTILNFWYNHRERRKLQMLGIRDKDIDKSPYTTDVLYSKVRSNPYTVPNLSMEMCNKLMIRFGKEPTCDQMMRGKIIRYVYEKNTRDAWAAVPVDFLRREFPSVDSHIEAITADTDPEENTPNGYDMAVVTLNGRDLVYRREVSEAENYITEYMANTLNVHNKALESDPTLMDKIVPEYTRDNLSPEQKECISGVLNTPISVITGGPGCGKTTCIVELVHNMEMRNMIFAICSFTGKAVVRVRQVLKQACLSENMISSTTCTLHRAIYKGMEVSNEQVTHLVLDETSMITTELFKKFLEKFPCIRWLVLVGDVNQLLPIGWGSMFKECITSCRVPVFRLLTHHRSKNVGEGQVDGIALNYQNIINATRETGFQFAIHPNFQVMSGKFDLVDSLMRQICSGGIRDNQLKIISPYNEDRGRSNALASELFRPAAKTIQDNKGRRWKLGDIIVALENNYDIDVMNGEEGRIIAINPGSRTVRVSFCEEALTDWIDGCDINSKEYAHLKKRSFGFSLHVPNDDAYGGKAYEKKDPSSSDLHVGMIDVGYAYTVHKAQGSEWDYCIFYVPERAKASKSFFCRNLVITAMSRGKTFSCIVGNVAAAREACLTKPAYRCEGLSHRLSEKIEFRYANPDREDDYACDDPYDDFEFADSHDTGDFGGSSGYDDCMDFEDFRE